MPPIAFESNHVAWPEDQIFVRKLNATVLSSAMVRPIDVDRIVARGHVWSCEQFI